EPSRSRLDEALRSCTRCGVAHFAELEPTGFPIRVLRFVRNGEVARATDPPLRMHVVDVKAAAVKPHGPATLNLHRAMISSRERMIRALTHVRSIVLDRCAEGLKECLHGRIGIGQQPASGLASV